MHTVKQINDSLTNFGRHYNSVTPKESTITYRQFVFMAYKWPEFLPV